MKNALRLHPDQEHMIYPMGNKVTIKHIASGEQSFLSGHTNLISAVCVSPCGNFVASGQINHLGFKVILRVRVISYGKIEFTFFIIFLFFFFF